MINKESTLSRPFAHDAVATSQGILPLFMLSRDSKGVVQEVRGKGEIKSFLENLGFVDRAIVTIVSKSGGNVIVNIKGSKIAISKAMAGKIMAAPL